MPDLVEVVSPDTEAELAVIVEMLEAHDVPCFVCDARRGWVSSGVHGCLRKPRTIMVPRTRVAEAAGLIGDLKSSPAAHEDVARSRLSSRLCALARFIWFGWYRPVARNFK
jgi:hypothetical protein